MRKPTRASPADESRKNAAGTFDFDEERENEMGLKTKAATKILKHAVRMAALVAAVRFLGKKK